jgi:hypothetical protein
LRIEGHAKAVVRQGVASGLRNAKAIGDRKRKFDRRIRLRQSTARKSAVAMNDAARSDVPRFEARLRLIHNPTGFDRVSTGKNTELTAN